MCNDFRSRLTPEQIAVAFSEVGMPLRFPEGAPNLEPRDDIRITDTAAIVRLGADGGSELVQRRWSWPGPGGKPVYNFRSEGRRFATGRCLIPAEGFYEFTDPPPGGLKGGRKVKWLFTAASEPWFCIAGLWRTSGAAEAWTMLTTEPGPDVAPYHARQIAVLGRADWRAWLEESRPEAELLRPAPAGTLTVTRMGD